MNLSDIRYILADCDGVLWHGATLIPGFDRFLEVLDRRGIKLALLSNNPVRTIDSYCDMVRRAGGTIDRRHIITSPVAVVEGLLDRHGPGSGFYVISGAGLKEALVEAGLIVYDGEQEPEGEVAGVVAANDPAATYLKVTQAMRQILANKPFYATNADRLYISDQGVFPGSGWIVRMLEAITGVPPVIFGKPERGIFDAALKRLGADPAHTVMIGDHMEADILGAVNAGLGTILVLTGVTSRDSLPTFTCQPDFVFESIAEVAEALS